MRVGGVLLCQYLQPLSVLIVCMLLSLLAGCAIEPRDAKHTPFTVAPPFRYEPLRVRNSCFVESVHFYDLYLGQGRGGDAPWVRILQWGTRDGDLRLGTGHAVAVFSYRDAVWTYDINVGFSKLSVPLDHKSYLSEVGPAVQARYPQFKPVFTRYREEFPQEVPKSVPEFLFYHANADVRDATKVASELGRYRRVGVIEFRHEENAQKVVSAAAVFVFGQHLCIYYPTRGTHVFPVPTNKSDDMRTITGLTERFFKNVSDVRWQSGGYWFFPPKQ